jgi:hypothetical protein
VTSTRRTLRVETPVLEPDDAFLARLAAGARLSVAPGGQVRRRRLGDWRVALAAAGVVVATTGGAFATGVLGPLPRLNPLDRPPVEETEPVPVPPSDDGSEGNQVEPPVGRPSEIPTEGTGRPTDRPTGPSGLPTWTPSEPPGQPSNLPTGQPSEPPGQPSGLPTPGVPTGRPTTTPSADPPAGPPGEPGEQNDRDSP